jgi:hypothetical protein
MTHLHQSAILAVDLVSAAAILGTLAGVLPPLAALGAVVWYAIQIFESDTVQVWLKGHRHVIRKKRLQRKHKQNEHHTN